MSTPRYRDYDPMYPSDYVRDADGRWILRGFDMPVVSEATSSYRRTSDGTWRRMFLPRTDKLR